MSRRTSPAHKNDDLRFAVRIKFTVPDFGLGAETDRLNEWLLANLGAGDFGIHGARRKGGNAVAVYLANPRDLLPLIEAFPLLELANE